MSKDRVAGHTARAAEKEAIVAQAWLMLDQHAKANTAANAAIQGTDDVSLIYPAAAIYIATGEIEKAVGLSQKLSQRFEPDPRAYGKLIEAEVQMKRGNFREAVQSLGEAKAISDTWLGRFDLGRAYLAAGAYTDADTEFDACMNRKGEATAVFLDDQPSWRYFVPVFYYLGRAQQELSSPAAADNYRKYLTTRGDDPNDRLAANARKQLQLLTQAGAAEIH
jgi:eukaryotic-like serine/threonine-protein kinase